MKISKKGQYALEALLYMAIHNEEAPHTIASISQGTGISHHYLEQIFFILRKERLLFAIRGPKGGFFLNMSLSAMTVGKVIATVENDLVPVPCAENIDLCPCEINDICSTRSLWHELYLGIYDVLDHVSLNDLLLNYYKR